MLGVGRTFFSVYPTPNETRPYFRRRFDALEEVVLGPVRQTLVVGFFNTRALEWGWLYPNSRGKRILEMTTWMGLAALNIAAKRIGIASTVNGWAVSSRRLLDKWPWVHRLQSSWRCLSTYTSLARGTLRGWTSRESSNRLEQAGPCSWHCLKFSDEPDNGRMWSFLGGSQARQRELPIWERSATTPPFGTTFTLRRKGLAPR